MCCFITLHKSSRRQSLILTMRLQKVLKSKRILGKCSGNNTNLLRHVYDEQQVYSKSLSQPPVSPSPSQPSKQGRVVQKQGAAVNKKLSIRACSRSQQ